MNEQAIQVLRFDEVLAQAPIGIAVLDHNGVYEEVNASYCSAFGYTRAQLLGQNVTLVCTPEEGERLIELHHKFLREGGVWSAEWTVVRHDASLMAINTVSVRIQGADGRYRRLVYVTDVTKQKEMAENLRRQTLELEQHYSALQRTVAKNQAIINAIPDLIFTNHRDGTFLAVEASDPSLLLLPPELFLHKKVAETMPHPIGEIFQEHFVRALDSGKVQVVNYALPIGGRDHKFEARVAAATQDTVITIVRDVSERKAMEERLEQLAFYDPLTGLANRRLLLDRLVQAVATTNRTAMYGAVIFLDLDNFKPLNDLHGHEVGDLLLIEVAVRLKKCVREMDTVGRFGGDEFVVMLSEIDVDKSAAAAHAELVAEKIRVSLGEPYRLQARTQGAEVHMVEHRCTASVGVALFGNNELNPSEVIRHADNAMYRSKDRGRNVVSLFV